MSLILITRSFIPYCSMIKRQKLPEKKLVSPNKAADDPNELGPNKQDGFTFRGFGPSDFVQEM